MTPTLDAEQRYRRLFDDYHRAIYAYCRRRTDAQTAADCAAQTFLTAWRRLDDVPSGESSLPWLYGVARRTLANEFRASRRRQRLHSTLRDNTTSTDPSPEIQVVRREQDEQVLRALASLRPRDREVLQLALWEELPHAAIAELLGCSTQAVTQRIYRATRQVCKEFQRLDRHHGTDRVARQSGGGELS
ncbi:MAG: sigma-70 family RNA polymerase sigma factor [Acidimicrobiia bacterium]|nr:sigma-70 family RNA polymerase sigma factor [Acidimicrobiia bacterium]